MSKKNLFLLGFLIIGFAFFYFYKDLSDKFFGDRDNDIFFSKINIEDVSRIEINKGEVKTILEKEGERWRVGNTKDFYIPSYLALNLEKGLKDAVDGDVELVSQNEDKKDVFQTDQEQGIDLKIFQGEELVSDLVVGKLSSNYMDTYISKNEIQETYSAKGALAGVLATEEWRDGNIFTCSESGVQKIRFQYPDSEFTIERSGEDWKFLGDDDFVSIKEDVLEVVKLMCSLEAISIPEQTFENTGLEKNLAIIQVSGNGIDNTLMIGESNENSHFYVKRANSDNIYLISSEDKELLTKKQADLN